jgi:hypothetical protein
VAGRTEEDKDKSVKRLGIGRDLPKLMQSKSAN